MDLTPLFEQGIKKDSFLPEIFAILNQHTKGETYLIGGKVYRTIISEQEGLQQPSCDYDFLVDHITEKLILPKGWQETQNKYGNTKLLNESVSVDIVPLKNVHSILRRKLSPTKENYLSGTPFTLQSILYDIHAKKVQGSAGIEAILTKTVRIHNYHEAAYQAHMKRVSVIDLLKEKAKSVGFTQVYI